MRESMGLSVHATLDRIERSLAREPFNVKHLIELARCLIAVGRGSEALGALNVAKGVAGRESRAWEAIGTLSSYAGDQQGALAAYARALELEPGNPQFLFNRASVRRFLGDLDGAERDYDAVIERRPTDFEAYLNRSELRRQTSGGNHIAQLEAVARSAASDWRGEVQVRFALAKEFEDLGEYAKSFEQLQRGTRLHRGHLRYDVAKDVATVDWIIEAFPVEGSEPASRGEVGDDDPVFIVGLPRSGTTLVERILGCHPSLTSAGELDTFAIVLVNAARRRSEKKDLGRRELVRVSATLDFPALGQAYLTQARTKYGVKGRFIDKMPLNYLYCGLIRRALPGARIVHVTRHPIAVCFAMYKTLFKSGYPFSYDLEEIAQYYLAYRRLMEHWRSLLGQDLYDISYESLVADQSGETRKLLECCGLQWDDACLRFYLNGSPSTTASAAQVRHPIYDSSVSQWRAYDAQLSDLKRRLQAGGIQLD